MLEWISAHTALLQVTVAVVTALVWMVYLQLFLSSFLRQRRPEILISRGPGVGLDARCFIANLGLEPLYVSQLLMTVRTAERECDASVTDREVLNDEQTRDPRLATNQGPLKSGDSYDAGSFGELMGRALQASGQPEDASVESTELTVVALHAGSASYVAASRRYEVIAREDHTDVVPEGLTTRQHRTYFARRRIRTRLQQELSWYRS